MVLLSPHSGYHAIVFNPSGLNRATVANYEGDRIPTEAAFSARANALVTAYVYPGQWLGDMQAHQWSLPVVGKVVALPALTISPGLTKHDNFMDRHGLDFAIPAMLQKYF